MQFQVGESVSMLHESGAYTIKQLSVSHAHVLDEFGFEYRIPISSLIKRTPIKGEVENKEPLVKVKPNALKKQALSSIPTLDLHATALGIDGMPPNELLETKLSYCRSFINQCIANRQSKALIIHGVGEGVLRMAVRQLLSGKKGISFHDGNYSSRGVGSTLVEIRLSEVSRF
jgi:dsDNA-specific endonuclease/ATPase MutS2